MKTCIALLFLLAAVSAAPAQIRGPKPVAVTVYAQFLMATEVELSDGTAWAMDKGDCFPVYMFKEQQTVVVLSLGSATFTTQMSRMRLMKESESETALASYRITLQGFLRNQTERWKKEATAKGKGAS